MGDIYSVSDWFSASLPVTTLSPLLRRSQLRLSASHPLTLSPSPSLRLYAI
nr:hypothetical protein Iba_chr13eCG9430 [Ipomoea batatas]